MDDSPPVSLLTPLLDSLARIEQRLDRLERITQHARQLPNATSMAVDSLDDAARRLQERGVDLEARMRNALASLEQLTSDQATAQLAQLVALAQQTPHALAMLVDVLDQHVAAAHERGIDLEQRLTALARLLEKLTAPAALAVAESLVEHLPSFDRLLGSGVLGSGPVDIVARAGRALSEAQRSRTRPLGAFGLLRALSDSDVQHALGFAIAFAKAFGRNIEPSSALRALPFNSET